MESSSQRIDVQQTRESVTNNSAVNGFTGSVGNTPLVRRSICEDKLTGCKIYGFQNPGDSVKGRAAVSIIQDVENKAFSVEDVSRIKPGGTVVDGTAGNTGIGLAHVCRARGYECNIDLLRMLGAEVYPALIPYENPLSYNHQAKEYAEKLENAIWIDQFENTANSYAHYIFTGPEIWEQTKGEIDDFACASGTGGTLAGVGNRTQIWLVDSPGSVLYEYVTSGGNLVERSLSSVTEGQTSLRVVVIVIAEHSTMSFNLGTFVNYLTGALHIIWDEEAIFMSYQLLDTESLYISASSALNSKVVTILCDGAHRYPSRLFSKKWLESNGLGHTIPDSLRKYAVLD
ncbi:pyridoxal phosphate-dependent enzyme beta subunit [Suillus subalutaceus]|uniref:pyridoxal phosphate-dependent enzyme beta subunit n=1 Tax=Suillus subalutaceus TaxID=48586 RepID=UPI001B8796B4|nr:pyridoxal phosphate-dependent enzyme beta subunit [Suillus subalutaceus]KAG1862523.1 pyridoxal phosphate-dependent enzyme beta subunit [Suillus subalutaceus]